MTQYGFYFDQGRCNDCQVCAAICKDWNGVPAGPAKWVRMYKWEEGTWPQLSKYTLFAPCYHCENPVCVDAAKGAVYKEPKYGAVLIDPLKATSGALRDAWEACPYGAIVFDSDASDATASKCTMCVDRLEQGLKPVCVLSCPMRALDFGPLDDMKQKYGNVRDMHALPSSTTTQPAVIFKPREAVARKQLVPYDTNKALQLFAGRGDGLSAKYTSSTDVTQIPSGVVRKDKLVLKAKDSSELMYYTADEDA